MKLGTASKKDVQTFKFVADALKLPLDTVARWFILSIIFVFDPLAICLILAYNVAVYRKEDESVFDKTVQDLKKLTEKVEVTPTPEPPAEPKTEPITPPEPSRSEGVAKTEEQKKEENRLNEMSDWFKRMFKL